MPNYHHISMIWNFAANFFINIITIQKERNTVIIQKNYLTSHIIKNNDNKQNHHHHYDAHNYDHINDDNVFRLRNRHYGYRSHSRCTHHSSSFRQWFSVRFQFSCGLVIEAIGCSEQKTLEKQKRKVKSRRKLKRKICKKK